MPWPSLPSCPSYNALNPRVHQRCGVYAFSMSGGQRRLPNCPPRDGTKQGAGVRQLPPGAAAAPEQTPRCQHTHAPRSSVDGATGASWICMTHPPTRTAVISPGSCSRLTGGGQDLSASLFKTDVKMRAQWHGGRGVKVICLPLSPTEMLA